MGPMGPMGPMGQTDFWLLRRPHHGRFLALRQHHRQQLSDANLIILISPLHRAWPRLRLRTESTPGENKWVNAQLFASQRLGSPLLNALRSLKQHCAVKDRSSFIETGRLEGLPRGHLVCMKRTVEPTKPSDPFFIPRAGPGFREL